MASGNIEREDESAKYDIEERIKAGRELCEAEVKYGLCKVGFGLKERLERFIMHSSSQQKEKGGLRGAIEEMFQYRMTHKPDISPTTDNPFDIDMPKLIEKAQLGSYIL